MERLEVSFHEHPLLPFTRFDYIRYCKVCGLGGYTYGGYRCNELGCCDVVFHKECAESLPEINHSSHPDHPLKFFSYSKFSCSLCGGHGLCSGYSCSVCGFKLDFNCAMGGAPLPILAKPSVHEHPLELSHETRFGRDVPCKACDLRGYVYGIIYVCVQCKLSFHVECVTLLPEAYHTSHSKHSLKFIKRKAAPSYADTECILCGNSLYEGLHHCDVCNFSVCRSCVRNSPPLAVVSPTTHEHQLHLVPRHIEFTCNACGTTGKQSPYFCLQCNFMIHWECIDLPRVININRHDHRISYTPRLGQGKWKCGVCHKEVDGFYGAYSCAKCPCFAVHSLCATNKFVWDMVELEGTPEEPEEIAPFEVVDDNTIKHFSHDHNLRVNTDGKILQESTICEACAFQICSEPFYSCEQCSFILHAKCANLPRKKRHVFDNLPFMLQTRSEDGTSYCTICNQTFTGFKYVNRKTCMDVRCGSVSEPFVHGSHLHPLYYNIGSPGSCSGCRETRWFACDECDFGLCFECGVLPQKVVRHRYDDHPLSLSYGERNVDGKYWCEACETKLNPEKWFYTCNDCGVVLHISCVVGDLTYIMPGPYRMESLHQEVVPNTSVSRTFCTICNMRCNLPSVLKGYMGGVAEYFCSLKCFRYRVMFFPEE